MPDLVPLLDAAETEGFDMMRRLADNWREGTNRFDRPGEVLLGVYLDEGTVERGLVAIGGLNIDPYLDDRALGRIRHVYVLPRARSLGVGKALVAELLERARTHFERVRLRTVTDEGSRFYEALGFEVTEEPDATHTLGL